MQSGDFNDHGWTLLVCPSCAYAEVGPGLSDDWCGHDRHAFTEVQVVERGGSMPEQFRGGPLEDGHQSQIHSLIVHMIGDGRISVGAYVQVYDDDIPLGVFEWHPDEDLVEYEEAPR